MNNKIEFFKGICGQRNINYESPNDEKPEFGYGNENFPFFVGDSIISEFFPLDKEIFLELWVKYKYLIILLILLILLFNDLV